MNEWQIVLLTGVVTIVTSIVTALITMSITHRNEVRKLVLEKRAELYFEFYDEAEHLLHDTMMCMMKSSRSQVARTVLWMILSLKWNWSSRWKSTSTTF